MTQTYLSTGLFFSCSQCYCKHIHPLSRLLCSSTTRHVAGKGDRNGQKARPFPPGIRANCKLQQFGRADGISWASAGSGLVQGRCDRRRVLTASPAQHRQRMTAPIAFLTDRNHETTPNTTFEHPNSSGVQGLSQNLTRVLHIPQAAPSTLSVRLHSNPRCPCPDGARSRARASFASSERHIVYASATVGCASHAAGQAGLGKGRSVSEFNLFRSFQVGRARTLAELETETRDDSRAKQGLLPEPKWSRSPPRYRKLLHGTVISNTNTQRNPRARDFDAQLSSPAHGPSFTEPHQQPGSVDLSAAFCCHFPPRGKWEAVVHCVRFTTTYGSLASSPSLHFTLYSSIPRQP
jgi:hypothetical protein